jgi:hypothetical protein
MFLRIQQVTLWCGRVKLLVNVLIYMCKFTNINFFTELTEVEFESGQAVKNVTTAIGIFLAPRQNV